MTIVTPLGPDYSDDVDVSGSDGALLDTQASAVVVAGIGALIEPLTLGFPAVIDLGTLSAADGFKIQGAAAQDFAGYSVASAGDINGDGFDDIIVGAHGNDEFGSYSGMAYVVFGKPGGFGFVNLAALAASDGFKIRGEVIGAFAGISVAPAGDVNGDGIADLIVGQDRNDTEDSRSGSAFVLFGATDGLGFVDLRFPPDATRGFTIQGEQSSDAAGHSVASAGDVNGDGFDDLIIGAPGNNSGDYNAGAAYVVFGRASGPAIVNLGGLAPTRGFKLQGDGGSDAAGYSVAGAGDINGDGFADIIVGAYGNNSDGPNAGAAYVLFGKAGGFGLVDLGAPLDSASGFKIIGEAFGDYAGISVAPAGDVNGDGLADLIVGAERNDNVGGGAAGAAYVLFGKTSGLGFVDLGAPIVAADGFKIEGSANSDFAGNSVAGAGDVNGDGFDDVIVGALFEDGGGYAAGAAYVLFGKASGFGTIGLGALDLADGFKIQGEVARDYAGHSVASAGDINGDGFADVIVGAYRNDSGGERAGAAYVIFGRSTVPPGGPPVIASNGGGATAAITVAENSTAVTTVFATDPDAGTTIAYSISGGADATRFAVDGTTGVLRFKLPPNFERPADSGANNSYDVVVRASDGTQFDEQAIAVTVADVGETVVPPPPPGFPAVIDLGALPPGDGFKIEGAAAGDFAGLSVATAGDVNGDGFADVIVGAYRNDGSAANNGAAYVLFGKAGGFGFVDLGLPFAAADGFKIEGEAAFDTAGISVASAGDVNGDGFADMIVGASSNDSGGDFAGAAYVLFGKASGFGRVDLGTPLAATDGFKIEGEVAMDLAGGSVASAGDINGDGLADIIIGARQNDSGGDFAGAAYVLFGKTGGFGFVDLGTPLAATDGFKIEGITAFDFAGSSVASAGDINGDGFDEIIVGAYGNDFGGSNAGAAFVIFGKAGGFGPVDLGTPLSAGIAFRIVGDAASDFAGRSVASAGDFNGDGLADVVVGAALNDSGGYGAGAAYVVYGRASGFSQIDLGVPLAGSAGFKIEGEAIGDMAGTSVAAAGDVNGDGFGDLIVGAQANDSGGVAAGAAYVLFGNANGVALIDLGVPLAATAGFKIEGEATNDTAGFSVAAAGDVNGDGFDDLLVGAFRNDSGGVDAGAAYVIFGRALNVPPVIVSAGGGAAAAISRFENDTLVTTVTATDPDPGTTIAYALSGGADAARFAIDAATGALIFITAPDFEAPSDTGADNVYDVIARADDGRLFDEQSISVTISDRNEAPVDLTLSNNIVVDDAPAGTTIGALAGVDPDPGDTLTYSLFDDAGGSFAVDAATGLLTVAAGAVLDALATPTLDIVVRVTDSGGQSYDETFALVLSDAGQDVPEVALLSITTVSEGTAPQDPGGFFIVLERTGNLSGVTSVSYTVAGSGSTPATADDLVGGFAGGIVQFAPSDVFASFALPTTPDALVEPNEGLIITLTGVTGGTLVGQPFFIAEIFNDDAGLPNPPPIDLLLAGGNVAENSPGGTVVGTLAGVDPGDALGYALIDDAGGRFAVDASSGVLRIADGATLDFEATPTLGIVASVTDSAGQPFVGAFTIAVTNVNDNAPIITSNGGGAAAVTSVAENATAVTIVAATDADTATAPGYAIAGGIDATRFAIDASTGALRFIVAPDFEAPADADGNNIYDVIVEASDGTFIDTQALAVSLTNLNEAPTAVADAVAVDAGATTPNLATDLLANDSDVDAGDTRAIVSVDATGTLGTLTFDADTQDLRYAANAATYAMLAPGQTATDRFSYTMGDAAGATSTAVVTVTVRGIDDPQTGPVLTGTAYGETIAGSDLGETIDALGGNDIVNGNAGSDTIDGGAGNDVLNGGADIDTVSFASASGGVSANLGTGRATGPGGDADRLAGFENLLGSSFDDVLLGDIGANTVNGGSGNDVVLGARGDDRLIGGAGNDVLEGGVGADSFVFDVVSNGAVDVITDFYVSAGDAISFGAGIDVTAAQVGFLTTAAQVNGVAVDNSARALDLVLTLSSAAGNQTVHILDAYNFASNAYWEGVLGLDLTYPRPLPTGGDLVAIA